MPNHYLRDGNSQPIRALPDSLRLLMAPWRTPKQRRIGDAKPNHGTIQEASGKSLGPFSSTSPPSLHTLSARRRNFKVRTAWVFLAIKRLQSSRPPHDGPIAPRRERVREPTIVDLLRGACAGSEAWVRFLQPTRCRGYWVTWASLHMIQKPKRLALGGRQVLGERPPLSRPARFMCSSSDETGPFCHGWRYIDRVSPFSSWNFLYELYPAGRKGGPGEIGGGGEGPFRWPLAPLQTRFNLPPHNAAASSPPSKMMLRFHTKYLLFILHAGKSKYLYISPSEAWLVAVAQRLVTILKYRCPDAVTYDVARQARRLCQYEPNLQAFHELEIGGDGLC
jgi:hypothetical protein